MSEFSPNSRWFGVDVRALGDDARRSILKGVKDKLGFTETCRVLSIAKSGLHRYLSGERRVPDEVARKALQFITRDESGSIVSDWDRLRALGVVGSDGTIDYGLALKILAASFEGRVSQERYPQVRSSRV